MVSDPTPDAGDMQPMNLVTSVIMRYLVEVSIVDTPDSLHLLDVTDYMVATLEEVERQRKEIAALVDILFRAYHTEEIPIDVWDEIEAKLIEHGRGLH